MLAILNNTPKSPQDWEVFGFNDRDQINLIRQAIQKKTGINLPEYELYPIPMEKFSDWLDRKSQAHTDFNSVLGLQSNDLTDVDIRDKKQLQAWIYLQYQELYNASAALGI